MNRECRICKRDVKEIRERPSPFPVTGGICRSCAEALVTAGNGVDLAAFLDSLDAPVLLMQPAPRQVYAANQRALRLFGKDISRVAGHRGGQVFDCIHAFTEAGCGKDVHCEGCKIRNAVVEAFLPGNSFTGVSTDLEIRTEPGTLTFHMQVSTEELGNFALLRIDRFEKMGDIQYG